MKDKNKVKRMPRAEFFATVLKLEADGVMRNNSVEINDSNPAIFCGQGVIGVD